MFYGRQMGMTRDEILNMKWGEFLDQMSCWSVYNGNAEIKEKKRSFFEVLELR